MSAVPAELAPPPLDPERHALFLDFDGTFVDFAPEPDAIRLRPGSIPLLGEVSRCLGGAFALVSGRTVADLDRFLAPLRLPSSGVHGQEFRPAAGETRTAPLTAQMEVARQRLLAAIAPNDPLLLEDKGGALVLHFRLHPEQAERAKLLSGEAIAGLSDLHSIEGHSIFEIRPRGISKALAVQLFAGIAPFARRLPVFVGDDTTDEDGIRAAAAGGGFGIKVGPGVTEAAYRLADVSAVHAWLGSFSRPAAEAPGKADGNGA